METEFSDTLLSQNSLFYIIYLMCLFSENIYSDVSSQFQPVKPPHQLQHQPSNY
jgi:hypothetical protein